MKLSSVLPLIGRLFTPLAMVVFLAYEISSSQQVPAGWQTAVIVGAVCTAVGVEVVGILSGHAVERFWRLGDSTRTAVSLLLLAVYTAAGTFILWGTIMVVVPLIAAVLYIVAALVEGVEEQVQAYSQQAETRSAFDLEQEALDRQAKRDAEAERLKSETTVKLARIDAKARPAETYRQEERQEERQLTGNLPANWRQLTREQRHDLAHSTRDERENAMPEMAERTRRLWHERLDGIAAMNGEYAK